jgi:ABC-type nitrate/sulfonate/bicarbonate transport system permease component
MSRLVTSPTLSAGVRPPSHGVLARLSHGSQVRAIRWGIVLALVAFLEVYGGLFADPAFMQPPSAVFSALFDKVLADPRIIGAIGMAIVEIGVAYGLSVVVGLALGLAIGATDLSRKSLFPIVLLLYAIPQVSLMPLFVLTFGLGPASKIAFGFSHGVFPIIVNVIGGIRNVNPLYMQGARSMGASRLDLIRYLIFPHMVPSFFVGLRLAMTLTLLGVILAELYVSTGGIGYFTKLFAESYNPAPLFALIGTLAAIAIACNEIVRLAERRLTPGTRRRAARTSIAEAQ